MKNINDIELEKRLNSSPAPRVTKEYIESRIDETKYTFMNQITRTDDTTTICTIYLDNGYTVRGEAACVSSENFDPDIGKRIAYDNAFNKLWPLFGFLLAEATHQGKD